MKNKGFTLIELLAVIIILGILMIIAIPSVTKYISDSRKSAYVDTAKQVASAAKNLVNSGKLEMYDTSVAYYIPNTCIRVENGEKAKSPYGEFIEDRTYVVVTYDGKGYDYYWVSLDETGTGVKEPISIDKLEEKDIETDLTKDDVKDNNGVGKNNVVVFNSSCDDSIIKDAISDKICKRATELNHVTCSQTSRYGYCSAAGYVEGKKGTTITYGNLGTRGELSSGDAFDCDVTGTGNYERFYYLRSEGDYSYLIYYNNYGNGAAYATKAAATSLGYTCEDSNGCNWYGPIVAYQKLPTTSQWANELLINPDTRNILNENGEGTTNRGNNQIQPFTYTDRAARLLNQEDLEAACGGTNLIHQGDLDGCNYLLENTNYERSQLTSGYWLETPSSNDGKSIRYIAGEYRSVNSNFAYKNYSIRPVITIKTSSLEK